MLNRSVNIFLRSVKVSLFPNIDAGISDLKPRDHFENRSNILLFILFKKSEETFHFIAAQLYPKERSTATRTKQNKFL